MMFMFTILSAKLADEQYLTMILVYHFSIAIV